MKASSNSVSTAYPMKGAGSSQTWNGAVAGCHRPPRVGVCQSLGGVVLDDDDLTIGRVGKAEQHAGAVNGSVQELVQRGIVPGNLGARMRAEKWKPGGCPALTADDAAKRWPDLVHARTCRAADRAATENGLADRRIALRLVCRYTNQITTKHDAYHCDWRVS
jgi:hypothetical protein